MLTGEAIPVAKKPGDEVIGGTINTTGSITFRATRVGKETALGQIVQLVEDAQATKAPIQKLADRVAGVFVPIVIALASRRSSCGSTSGRHPRFSLRRSPLVHRADHRLSLRAWPRDARRRIPSVPGGRREYGILIRSGEALRARQGKTVCSTRRARSPRGSRRHAHHTARRPDGTADQSRRRAQVGGCRRGSAPSIRCTERFSGGQRQAGRDPVGGEVRPAMEGRGCAAARSARLIGGDPSSTGLPGANAERSITLDDSRRSTARRARRSPPSPRTSPPTGSRPACRWPP